METEGILYKTKRKRIDRRNSGKFHKKEK